MMDQLYELAKGYQEKLKPFDNDIDLRSGTYHKMKAFYDDQFKRDMYVILTQGKQVPTYDDFTTQQSLC